MIERKGSITVMRKELSKAKGYDTIQHPYHFLPFKQEVIKTTKFSIGDEVQSISDPGRVGVVIEIGPMHAGIQYYRRIVGELGERLRLKVRPHGLRHAAITKILDLTRGDVRAVARFSRHRDIRTLTRYDDNRVDLGGEVARLVAAGV